MKKYQILLLSLLFDALGFVSFLVPGIGEFSCYMGTSLGLVNDKAI